MVSRLNLLQQKQLQWAKEREELKNFGGLWGGVWNTQERGYRPCIRSQFRSSIDLPVYREEEGEPKRRTPSLPPIGNNYEQADEEGGGEDTSGYASDSAGAEYNAGEPWPKSPGWPLPHFPRRTPDSISSGSGREERARWGDRGVGVGHLWEPSPTLPPPPLPMIQPATPSWIQRGLQEPPQVLVISHNDDAASRTTSSSQGTTRSCDTPLSSEGSQRSFVRGQNAPLDPAELEERERKRQRALEHQNAIKKQLEEKEKLKREEQERLEREERLAEERLRKQQEMERQRLEDEIKRQKEKQEKDERIAKAMREALEAAEKAAREEKARSRRKHLREASPHQQPPAKEQTLEIAEEHNLKPVETPGKRVATPGNQDTPRKEEKAQIQETPKKSPRRTENRMDGKGQQTPNTLPVPKHTLTLDAGQTPPYPEKRRGSGDSTRPATEELELSVRLEQLEIEAQNLSIVADSGRILTPSKYRPNRAVERSTQTEAKTRSKTTKRYLRIDERPKWGVNRPTNQYIKASDRDPYRRSRARTSPRDSSSRSPSPLDESKASYKSVGSLGKSNATYSLSGPTKGGRVTRGVCTPRVMQVVPTGGIIRKSSAGRRIISIKGSIGLNGSRRLNRPQQTNVLPKNIEVSEFLTVNQVLTQLMDLKQGLQMKQKEWEITRSPTPFSEISFQ